MSRAIDWEKPLSDEDREWALQFPINHERVRMNDEVHGGKGAKAKTAEVLAGEDVKPYEEWTRDELATEAVRRGLSVPTKSNKAGLIALLEADDDAAAEEAAG
jgi:hypothetical protein